MRFNGKVAVVTGATGGIGQVLVGKLAQEGARLVITGRSALECAQLADRLGAGRSQIIAVPGDVTEREHCERLIDEAVSTWGTVDLLFNNAGAIPRGTIVETTDEMWITALDVNLTASFYLCRAAIAYMREHGGGAIVNTSSAWGIHPGPGHLAYCTAKAALAVMTKCLGRDHAHEGIRVNAVCPNEVDTPMLRAGFTHRGLDPDSALKKLDATVPLGHVASPEEIVDAMLFLASHEARYVTGATLEVTGAKPVY